MRASVVVPTHGRRDLSARALESLAAQCGAPAFEVIVVDDGADPGLGDHVLSLGLDLDVRVIHHARNRGRSATRNTGIAASRGEVVIFLDGDMLVEPDFVAGHTSLHEGGNTVVLGDILTAPEVPRTAFVEYIDTRGVQKVAPGESIPARYFMTGNSSVSRPLLERAGGFDEEFDEYGGEDTEMGYRLTAHGGRFRHGMGIISWHLDLNSVPLMAERLRSYGERMVPILVRKAPQAHEDLRLAWIEPVDFGRDRASVIARKLVARIVCRRLFWAAAARLGEHLPKGFGVRASFLFDFVRVAAYLDGYRRARSGSHSAGTAA